MSTDILGGYFDSTEDDDFQKLNSEINNLLGNLPYFFQIPVELFSQDRPKAAKAPFFPFRHELSRTGEENGLGLRLYIIPPDIGPRTTSQHLAISGLVQTGDLLLSFRQGASGTGEYQHIQLGLTHTGLALVRDGILHNIDNPLSWCGPLDADHYTEDQLMLHILRPHYRSGERENLQQWMEALFDNRDRIRTKISFNTDYGAPKFQAEGLKMIANLGQIIATGGQRGRDTSTYCSELAWALMALRSFDLSDTETRRQFEEGRTPASLSNSSPLFAPMPVLGEVLVDPDNGLPGLADGIGLVLNSLALDPPQTQEMVDQAFSHWTPHFSGGRPSYEISSGHQGQAEKFAELYEPLKDYFTATVLAPDKAKAIKDQLAPRLADLDNYSPTSFLVQALLPETSPHRNISYLGTLSFPTVEQMNLIAQRHPRVLRTMTQKRPTTLGGPPPMEETGGHPEDLVAVQFRDGFRGVNAFKRDQVKKLQCMLQHLGKNLDAFGIDGLYGKTTTRAVAEWKQDLSLRGDGRSVTWGEWRQIVAAVPDTKCSEYGTVI